MFPLRARPGGVLARVKTAGAAAAATVATFGLVLAYGMGSQERVYGTVVGFGRQETRVASFPLARIEVDQREALVEIPRPRGALRPSINASFPGGSQRAQGHLTSKLIRDADVHPLTLLAFLLSRSLGQQYRREPDLQG
jgi:hypothetical protein